PYPPLSLHDALPIYPADAKTRETVDLRKPAGHDNALAPAAERRALLRGALGSAIDLVGQDPYTFAIRDANDALHLGLREDLSGRDRKSTRLNSSHRT